MIPAIDLLGGRCVRLRQGSYDEVERYAAEPVETAHRFVTAGAKRLHIVDLDGADGRTETNRPVIEAIRREVRVPLEVGGGIRSEAVVEGLLAAGVDRLIVGTLLAREPERVGRWIETYGPRFVAGIDARDGEAKVAGWREGTTIRATDLALRAAELGALSVIYTDIGRDGMLGGPNLEETNRVAAAAGIPVIVSGGVSSLSDLEEIERSAHPLIRGVIAGKAIYEGRLDLEETFARFPGSAEEVTW